MFWLFNLLKLRVLQDAIGKFEKPFKLDFEIKEQSLFNVAVMFTPQVIKYLDDFQGQVRITIPESLREYIQEVELIFNDKKYNIVSVFVRKRWVYFE